MMIDRINSVNSGFFEKTNRNARTDKQVQSDSIRLSPEALEKSELYHASEIVNSASDVRADRVAEIKQRINDPSFLNEEVLNATADKILTLFGI
jgi:negative regulator of flagellin synthesis FlgM